MLHVLPHPSPTRRSSDLLDAGTREFKAAWTGLGHQPADDRPQPVRHAPHGESAGGEFDVLQKAFHGSDAFAGAFRFGNRSEEHTSELQSLMRISYAVFCLKKKNKQQT